MADETADADLGAGADVGREAGAPASPVCYAAEADAAYRGFLSDGETAAFLTALRRALADLAPPVIDPAARDAALTQAAAASDIWLAAHPAVMPSGPPPVLAPGSAGIAAAIGERLSAIRDDALFHALAGVKIHLTRA